MRRAALVIVLFTLVAALPQLAVAPSTGTPVAYAIYPAPTAWGLGAGEPSIGVNWNTGNVFFQNLATTLRVSFNGATMPATATWTDVTPPDSILNIDPILFTDPTWGRTFAGGLDGACSVLSYTDDDGASWTPMTNSCAAPAYDHESIASGAAALGGVAIPHVVYYCAQENVIMCASSVDGGLTFNPAVPVQCGYIDPGLHGSITVAKNGVAYLPVKNCGGTIGVAYSKSNGATWSYTALTGMTTPSNGFDPTVATTPAGWAYLGMQGANNHPYVALSKNNGTTWSMPVDVGASAGIQQATFVKIVTGDDSRASLAFLGSTTSGNGFLPNFTGVWDLYVATTYDTGATWSVVKATTDPVQRGWICDGGFSPGCGGLGGTTARNLLDFIDAKIDAQGRVVVAFADGCIGACATPSGTAAQSTTDYATIARQTCGPSLFASVGNLEGTTPCSVATPPPLPATPLTGTLYMSGVTPVSQLDTVAGIGGVLVHDTFTQTAPTSTVPKIASNVAIENGANARTFYDASWAIDAPTQGFVMNGTTVTAHLFIIAHGATTAQLGTWKLTLSLSDLHATDNAPLTGAFATTTKDLTLTPGVNEVVVTFPAITRTLTNGFTLTVAQNGAGETDTLYDAASTPTRVEFS